jgi:ribose transport system ATP-binding protein
MEKKLFFRTEGIFKSFASTRALVDVSIELAQGEVLGLIGENGSGKSTLSAIISGILQPDKGRMFIDDKEYSPASISDAMQKGISIVVQEQGTLNGISVAANIFAGKEQIFSRYGILDTKRMSRKAKELLTEIGVTHIDPDVPVDSLSFEERKLLEVARAKFNDPRILIVDETTTALGKEGRSVMYSMIELMRSQGKSVIFISHDIDELLSVCDKVTVLRDGVVVGSLSGDEIRADSMKKMMVGREVPDNMYRTDYGDFIENETVLEGRNISCGQLKDISLFLRRGEILGIGGLTDCGMHELGKVLSGLTKPDLGTVKINQSTYIHSSGDAVRNAMGYVSKNRDTEALMGACSIMDNICLPIFPRLARIGLISPKRQTLIAHDWGDKLNIKMRNPKQLVMQLSGGNKQKVSIAKWLASNADIMIFDCPTRGIDIGVKNDIYNLLYELRNSGRAILMISEELPELIGMSDRIMILKNGVVSGELTRSRDLTESSLLDYMI